MADLFISYSRRDREFVVRLNAALEKRDYDVWVDLEDIPPTADWMEEIRTGIEGSDAYVFVISPDSIASKVCRQELDHAVEHNKRLVPVVCREVDPDTVPESLRSRNWIFFNDGDPFDEGFQELVDAISTDLEWLHEHTRLLTRAIEWDKSGRDNSFALRGSDLRTAEEWQVRATEKEPKLTPLQTEYILASRKTANRRQRLTLAAVTFGLVVAGVLAVLFYFQRNEAQRQAKIALGRQLTAQAQVAETQGPQSLQQSVLFATEAEKQSPLHSPEAERILRQGLDLLPRPVVAIDYEDKPDIVEMDYGATHRMGKAIWAEDGKYLAATNAGKTARVWDTFSDREVATVTHGGKISDIALSPDGEYLATASDDKSIRVWDASSGEEISSLDHDGAWNIEFSPDGRYLATAGGTGIDDSVRVWDPESGSEIARMTQDDLVLGIAFSPDSQLIAIANANAVGLWDPSDGEQMATLDYGAGSPTVLAFSQDGKYLAGASGINTGDTTATVWDVASRKQVTQVSHEGSILDVEFSPDSGYFATASDDGTARLWQVSGGKEITRLEHQDLVSSVDFSPDGRYLATASYDNTARVWDLTTGGEEVARVIHRDTVKDAVFSPDGRYLATASSDNTARVWDLASSNEFAQMVHADVNAFAASPDGQYLATAGLDGTTRVWDVASGEEVALMAHGANVMDVAFTPDAKQLATGGVDNTARLWDVTSGEEISQLDHQGSVDDVAFSPDGKYLATGSEDNTIRLWNTTSGEEVERFAYGTFSPSDTSSLDKETRDALARARNLLTTGAVRVEFSPDGEYLAASNRLVEGGGTARVWALDDGSEVARLSHEKSVGASVSDIAFGPGGKRLATASDDGTARVWDVASEAEVTVVEHQGSVSDVEFSPDGERLATASADNTARVWDAASGEEVARMTHEGFVNRATFSSSGRYLATASNDNTARVWDVASGTEVARKSGSMIDTAFGPGDEYLVTVGPLTRAWLWRPSYELVEEACTRLTRNFTTAEWQQNLPEEEYHETCPALPGSASLGISAFQDEAGSEQLAVIPGNKASLQGGASSQQESSQNAGARVDDQKVQPSNDTAPESRGEDTSDPAPDYNVIETPDGSLSAEVPQSWGVETGENSEKGAGPNTWSYYAGEYLTSSITTAPNLDVWYGGEEGTSGAYFAASRALARYSDYELTHSLFNADKEEVCAERGPYEDLNRPPLSGKIQTWYGCGEDGATVYSLAASPEGRGCVVVLNARVSNRADREAIEHLVDTVEVDCSAVA